MGRFTFVAALAAALLLAACGDGSVEPAPPVERYTLAVSAQPLVAEPQADDARAVEAVIPPGGGTLVATGADGTLYTLHVPTGALPQGARIRMAPLAALRVPGVDADAAFGVVLGPAGLAFFKPAELTIAPPASVAMTPQQQIPVGWSGAANTVSLAALQPASAELRLSVMHFSGYAILFSKKGMTSSLSGVRERLGGSAEDRIASAVSERLAQDRQRTLEGRPGEPLDALLGDLLHQFVGDVLLPRLAAAGTSCAAGRLALQTLLSHARLTALLGLPDDPGLPRPMAALVEETLGLQATACMREEYEICRDEHLVTRVVPAFLTYSRMAALLGLGDPQAGAGPAWLHEAEEFVRRCLQFELQFDSAVDLQVTRLPQHTMHERVESRVKIGYQLAFTEPPATSPPPVRDTNALLFGDFRPLAARDYAVQIHEDCADAVVTQAVGGALAVSMMGFTPVDPFTPRPQLADLGLSLALQPGASEVRWQQAQRDGNGACTNPQPQTRVVNWFTHGLPLLAAPFTTPDAGLYVTGWSVNHGSDILATRDLDLGAQANGERSTLSVRLVLFHTPL